MCSWSVFQVKRCEWKTQRPWEPLYPAACRKHLQARCAVHTTHLEPCTRNPPETNSSGKTLTQRRQLTQHTTCTEQNGIPHCNCRPETSASIFSRRTPCDYHHHHPCYHCRVYAKDAHMWGLTAPCRPSPARLDPHRAQPLREQLSPFRLHPVPVMALLAILQLVSLCYRTPLRQQRAPATAASAH